MTKQPTLEDLIKLVEDSLESDKAKTEQTVVDTTEARSFAEKTSTELESLKAELAKQAERNTALERQLELQTVSQTVNEIHSFTDALVADGKLPPALKERAVILLGVVANLEGTVKSYALGDAGEDAEATPFGLVTELLKSLPTASLLNPIPKFGKDGDGTEGKADVRRFSTNVEASDEMHKQIKVLQQAEGMSYMQAFHKIKLDALPASK